jgi:hypothetical protein
MNRLKLVKPTSLRAATPNTTSPGPLGVETRWPSRCKPAANRLTEPLPPRPAGLDRLPPADGRNTDPNALCALRRSSGATHRVISDTASMGVQWVCARSAMGVRWRCDGSALGERWACAREVIAWFSSCPRVCQGGRLKNGPQISALSTKMLPQPKIGWRGSHAR